MSNLFLLDIWNGSCLLFSILCFLFSNFLWICYPSSVYTNAQTIQIMQQKWKLILTNVISLKHIWRSHFLLQLFREWYNSSKRYKGKTFIYEVSVYNNKGKQPTPYYVRYSSSICFTIFIPQETDQNNLLDP